MNYLQRRGGGIYYLRLSVPVAVRSAIGKREICFSLETRNRAEALLKSLPHIQRFLLEFQQAKSYPRIQKEVRIAEPLKAGIDFLEVAERYLTERKLTAGSERNLRSITGRFVDIIGNKDIRLYTKKDIIAFKDTLIRYPVNVRGQDRQLSVEELLKKHRDSRKIGSKTINDNYLAFIRVIFDYARINDLLDKSPAEGVKLLAGDSGEVKRLPFTVEQVQYLLKTELFQHKQDDRKVEYRWLICLGLYTGARAEELARLRLKDIGEEDGIRFLFIQPYGEHSLKTLSSRRRVPIHPTLWERFCFGEYVERGRLNKQDYLFPLLIARAKKNRKAGHAFGSWFGKYLDSVGLSDKRLCYHSFRHSMKAWGRACNVNSSVLDALQGHALTGASYDYGRDPYGSPFALKTLYEGLLKIEPLSEFRLPVEEK